MFLFLTHTTRFRYSDYHVSFDIKAPNVQIIHHFVMQLTDFATGSHPARWALTREAIWLINARASVMTRVALAFIDINLTFLPWECVQKHREKECVSLNLMRILTVNSYIGCKVWTFINRHHISCPKKPLTVKMIIMFSPRYPGGQTQEALRPALLQ